MYQCFIAFNSRIINIPVYECTRLCLSIHRFMSIWVVSPLDCCAQCCYEHLCSYFPLNTFSSLGYIPSSGITERSEVLAVQSCLTLCDPMDCSPPNSSAHGVLQARILEWVQFSQFSRQSCPTLCNPMNRSTPGLPVHHQLPEFTQTHVYRVSDAIQPSHPLSSPSPPAHNPSQHQSLFQ